MLPEMRDHLFQEMDHFWVQSVMEPWTKTNLSYWIRETNRRLKLLNPGFEEEAEQFYFHQYHVHRLQKGLDILSRT
jgi:hypothetical protein